LVNSQSKRIVVKAGRRGGKTVGIAKRAVMRFVRLRRRQLYAAPTNEQTDTFWFEVNKALRDLIDAGVYKVNQTERSIEFPGTKQRLKAKTAWNANTLRGDYADDLYLDEFQLMNEDTWDEVGAPMLLDNNGDAMFVFTPPSLVAQGVSKARDPRHASKLFARAQADTTGLWQTIHFASMENPFISAEALAGIARDMSRDSYRREILAQDDEIQASWLVYSNFKERICKIPRFPIPASWLVCVGHDFGAANPAAVFLAENPGTGEFFAFKEYLPGAGLSTAQHVEKFQEIAKGLNVIKRVGGNVTSEDEIRQGYTAHGWPIIAPKLARVGPQIDRVKGMMELNKVFIFDDLVNLLTEVFNCMWKLDTQNQPTDAIADEQRYHLLAALRYVASDFTPETVSGQRVITRRSNVF